MHVVIAIFIGAVIGAILMFLVDTPKRANIQNSQVKVNSRYGGAEYARLATLYDQLSDTLTYYDALITRYNSWNGYTDLLTEARTLHTNLLPIVNRAKSRLDRMFKPNVHACDKPKSI